MNPSESSHCRLCAEIKPIGKLISLESDNTKRAEIEKKLTRLNTKIANLFEGDILPKTVCLICVNSLDRAFEFLETVEHAQELLNITYKKVKKESISDDDHTGLLTADTPVKVELIENLEIKVLKKTVKKRTSVPKRQLTWKSYKWACGKCGTKFPNTEQLKTHSMTYHECCNSFKCTDCDRKMLRLDKFLLHVKRHKKYLKLSCYICNSKFPSSHRANIHKKIHMISEHICPGCNTAFPSSEEMSQHIKTYYKNRSGSSIAIIDSSDSLTCMLCKKSFKNKSSLNGHLLIHTQRAPKKRAHICDRCGKGYFNKADLAAHVVTHDDARPFQCEICKSDFKTLIRLKAHIKVHNDFKPHSCVTCGRCFRLRKQLRSHEIIHTDSLPFVCPYCSKAFRFKSILDLHLRQHTGVKPYCCEVCQRNFTNWSNYNKHMKRRHGTSMAKRKPNLIVVQSTAAAEIPGHFPPLPDKRLDFV